MSRSACILGEPTGWHAGRLAALLERRGFRPTIVRWRQVAAGIGCFAEDEWGVSRTADNEAIETATGRQATDSFRPVAFAAADVVVVRGMPGGLEPQGTVPFPPPPRGLSPQGTVPFRNLPGSSPQARLEEVILRMDVLARLAASGTPVVNPPRALEIAIDKYLSLSLLAAAGLPVPKTIAVQDEAAAVEAWESLGGDCVVKPMFGSQGRGIVRVTEPGGVAATVATGGGVVYLQEFVPHDGWDARVLVVGDRAFAMRRTAPAGGWLTNLAQGGTAGRLELPRGWRQLARRAAATVGASLAGVDILPGRDGRPLVLEVNAVPGWRGIEAILGPEVGEAVVDHVTGLARV